MRLNLLLMIYFRKQQSLFLQHSSWALKCIAQMQQFNSQTKTGFILPVKRTNYSYFGSFNTSFKPQRYLSALP